jgi:large subunit ribosomal protein L6
MVKGVSEGYQKNLQVIGTGYSAERIGPWLKLSLGYSHDIIMEVPEGLTVETEAVPRSKTSRTDLQSIIRVKGIDKQLVGEFAAEIRACRPPENYKGKGIRYENESVIIKAGKAGTK